jgi:hypothetical protein
LLVGVGEMDEPLMHPSSTTRRLRSQICSDYKALVITP